MISLNHFYPSPGCLIVLEGADGCGKSTQIRLLFDALCRRGFKVVVSQTPGGSTFGQKVREILFHADGLTTHKLNGNVCSLMYLSSHLQSWDENVKPSLDRGQVVLCDRWDGFSGQAYAAAGTVPIDKDIAALRTTMSGPVPDLTLYLHGDPEVLLKRTEHREESHQDGKKWAKDVEKMHAVKKAYNEIFSTIPNVAYIEADKLTQEGIHETLILPVVLEKLKKKMGSGGSS